MSSGDRAALVALFRSTGGTRWRVKDKWDTDADLSQWYGVQVNEDGRVVQLVLNHNNLKGTIPEVLGVLKDLKGLHVYNNKLTGPIPEALRTLKELTHLDFGRNKLTGSIPAWLGSLQKLQQLGLYHNHLGGPIPEELGALKELTILYLNYNMLTGSIPTSLGSLVKLELLKLQSNQLVGVIPTELANLSALSKFRFKGTGLKAFLRRGNKLTGGPAEGERLHTWRERIRRKHDTKRQTLKGSQKEEDVPVLPPSTLAVLQPQQQERGKADEKEEDAPVVLGASPQREETAAERVHYPEHAYWSPEKAEKVDRMC